MDCSSPEVDGGASGDDGAAPNDTAMGGDAGSDDATSADVAADARADAARDARPRDARVDGCVAGPEVCDGLDNNCDGVVDEGGACSDGCVGLTHQGAGYMFCYGDAVHRIWDDAQADCVSRGMHLVRIDDQAENAFVNDSAIGLGFREQIWLGGRFLPAQDEWRWTDGAAFWRGGPNGQPVGGLFSNWRNGEPQNFSDVDNCADKRFNDTEVWEDLSCATVFAYLCER